VWTAIDPDRSDSSTPCQQVRAVSIERLVESHGIVGPAALSQIRETLADLLDL